MRKLVFLSLLSISFFQISLAQEIKAYKTFSGVRFEMDTLTLGLNQVLAIVKENPKAYAEMKRAKLNYNVAGALGFTGVIMVGVPIVTALAGGDPEWGLAAGGAALILTSIPFTAAFRSRTMEGLDLYNNKNKTSRVKSEFQFYGTGGRLIFRF